MKQENTPTIKTERLILRKFTIQDTNALLEMLKDNEMNTYLPWHPLKSISEAKVFLNKNFLEHYNKPSMYRYAICLKDENIPIGYVWLADNDSCDFGYGIKSDYWNQGLVSEAAKAVVERIKEAGYTYITATHDIKNTGSAKVMKKIGMSYKYTYVEQWQPKDIKVTFRMYQLNFDGIIERTYLGYWNRYENHFIEENIK